MTDAQLGGMLAEVLIAPDAETRVAGMLAEVLVGPTPPIRSVSQTTVPAIGSSVSVDVPATFAGDIVIVIDSGNYASASDEITSISGLGATWSEVTTVTDNGVFSIWKGVSPTPSTSSRTVTGTGTSLASERRVLTAFVVPNGDSRVTAEQSVASPDSNPQQSPVMTPNTYDRVIAMGYSDDVTHVIDSATPSNVSVQAGYYGIVAGRYIRYAYWQPTAANGVSHSITNSRVGGGARSVIIRVPSTVPLQVSNGSSFTRAMAVHTSNGSVWTGVKAVHTSNGSTWTA